jgi:hypothetical protein
MSLFSNYADIPKPKKSMHVDKKKVKLSPDEMNDVEAFKWLHQKTNYLTEMMKFFPDMENQEYGTHTEDDDEILEMMKQYGSVAETAEAENTPGHFGHVKRDFSEQGLARGYGMGDSYEEVDLNPEAGEFEHIDAEIGGFEDVEVYDPKESSLAGMSAELWSEVQECLAKENRSYYEIAMDNNGELTEYSNKEAYLLMSGMLESRTRVWLTMEELFGSFNETDDQKRIAVIDSWVAMAEKGLDPQNIALLSLFLDTQESFINRISAFYGAGTGGYLSYEDKERIPNFYNKLQEKVQAYRFELESSGKMAEVAELDELWETWTAPADDQDAYPHYDRYSWATTPGNILANENSEEDERQVAYQTKGLEPSEYKGLRSAEVEIEQPDGSIIIGNPYDQIWGTHIQGVFTKLVDKYVAKNLIASIFNRRKNKNYAKKKEEYEQKIWDRMLWEKAMAKASAKKKTQRAKTENKIKASTRKQKIQSEKLLKQALAKKRAAMKQAVGKTRSKIGASRRAASRGVQKLAGKGRAASKSSMKKLAGKIKNSMSQANKASAKFAKRARGASKKAASGMQRKVKAAVKSQNKAFGGMQKKSAARNKTTQRSLSKRISKLRQQTKRSGSKTRSTIKKSAKTNAKRNAKRKKKS